MMNPMRRTRFQEWSRIGVSAADTELPRYSDKARTMQLRTRQVCCGKTGPERGQNGGLCNVQRSTLNDQLSSAEIKMGTERTAPDVRFGSFTGRELRRAFRT